MPVNKWMRICFTSIIIVYCCKVSHAQSGRYPVKKIYTYSQSKVGGVNNPRSQNKSEHTFYRIYLELWKDKKIEITHLWIRGNSCGFRTESVTPPVKNNSDSTIFLVPETAGEVIEVLKETDHEPESNSFKYCPSRYKHFPVLIRYRENGKLFYLGSYPKALPKEFMQ
jgi:hypothetical protein